MTTNNRMTISKHHDHKQRRTTIAVEELNENRKIFIQTSGVGKRQIQVQF